MKYLLPCPCGKTITIDNSDVGCAVTCECGASVEAPALRGLSELKIFESESEDKFDRQEALSNWTPIHGTVFVVGTAIFLIAMSVAARYFYETTQVITDKPPSLVNEEVLKQSLDGTTYEGSLSAWQGLVETGLGPYVEPGYVTAREDKRRGTALAMLAGGIGLVGLLMIVGAVVTGRGSRV
ncbi:MAG: hypothetical protein ACI9G1_000304 [Pirellulaceae bacterium]|jgi:hypothetical protein